MIIDEEPVAPEASAHGRKRLLSFTSGLIVCLLFVALAAPRPTGQPPVPELAVDQLVTPAQAPLVTYVYDREGKQLQLIIGPEQPAALWASDGSASLLTCSGHWVFVSSAPVRVPATDRRLSPVSDQRASTSLSPFAVCMDDSRPRPETAPLPNIAR